MLHHLENKRKKNVIDTTIDRHQVIVIDSAAETARAASVTSSHTQTYSDECEARRRAKAERSQQTAAQFMISCDLNAENTAAGGDTKASRSLRRWISTAARINTPNR